MRRELGLLRVSKINQLSGLDDQIARAVGIPNAINIQRN